MRVLYLPYNIASMHAITNEAMNKLPGIESFCLSIGSHKYNSTGSSTILVELPSKKKPIRYLRYLLLKYYYFIKLILWADVVHYMWGSFLFADFDLRIIKWLKKPGVVEWVGSDIRCPSKGFHLNSYYRNIFYNGYEHAHMESDVGSDERQRKFRDIGLIPVCAPEMQLYINNDYFPSTHTIMQRIILKDFIPSFPNVHNKKPLIIHSPSAKIAKGSNLIIPVIEELRKNYDFEFMLLHDLPHQEVLRLMQVADIFIDDVIIGAYGMAAMEAMSFGKPVMCYIMPSLYSVGLPKECPIINTNPDNLKEQLINLITNSQLRFDLGVKSRNYIEKYHDADKIALQLVEIYKSAIEGQINMKTADVVTYQN